MAENQNKRQVDLKLKHGCTRNQVDEKGFKLLGVFCSGHCSWWGVRGLDILRFYAVGKMDFIGNLVLVT